MGRARARADGFSKPLKGIRKCNLKDDTSKLQETKETFKGVGDDTVFTRSQHRRQARHGRREALWSQEIRPIFERRSKDRCGA
ncbi:hypothetical protein Nham_0850 [Nitrobacter hamburgensis X14]|uniref:Uncharacterized protein n=1 Tax=Nitrobacter hamburgensis (strain DSM 10229 / NCIMB 13809 / X14) TaxID=323097 RepID=Q1QPX8_NITHX|nr:hypothetical protein Nham_0850 [Nitrobacter hamburgensis X14]